MSDNKISIYNPFTEKNTKVDPYGKTAKKIYRYMIDEGEEASTFLPDDLTYRAETDRFIRVKTIADTANVRRITYSKVKASAPKNDTMPYFRKIIKSYAGQTIKLVKRYVETEILLDDDADNEEGVTANIIAEKQQSDTFDIPVKGFSQWWNANSFFFWIESDLQLFGDWNDLIDDAKLQAQLLILTLDKIDKEDINQYFLDGITHCFFYPIKEWCLEKIEDSKSPTAKKRYNTINNKCNKYMVKYSEGIPEEDLGEVCNDLQISIEIDLPSTILDKQTKYIEIESQKKPLKKFRFVNTRLNHIEINNINTKDNYIEVNKQELKDIYDVCIKDNKFILWKECKTGITQINDLDKIYKLKEENSYNEIVKSFEEDYNLSDYKIEKNKNNDLTRFLNESLNTNQSIMFMPEFNNDDFDANQKLADCIDDDDYLYDCKQFNTPDTDDYEDKKKLYDWIDDLKNLNHIDIKKAYTQGHNCSMYQGYLGKITDFRNTDKIVGLGIYEIKNINFNGCKYIENMKCLHNSHPYPSPELEFYKSLGITFDIVRGCWGSGFDFEFPPSMYEKEDGLAHYCKWYGCLMKINDKDRYNFNCKDINFAKLNAYRSETSIRYNYDEKSGIIEYDKKYCYHSFHIAAFISSYARITLLEQILKFNNFNQIIAVVVDGIYYRDNVDVGELFANKEQKSLKHTISSEQYVTDYYYEGCEEYRPEYKNIGEYRDNNQYEIHLGAGGCGKTHNNLIDKGFVNPLFIAPSWKLARNKKDEYGIDSTTFFHTLDEDPSRWRPLGKKYSVFVVDEISMFSDEAKELIIERFPYHKIIFCGDVGFQLPPIEGTEFKVDAEVWQPTSDDALRMIKLPVFHHTTNYRCQCKKLETILLKLRNIIKRGVSRINIERTLLNSNFELTDFDSIDYCVKDLIICSTHKQKDKYTKKYANLEKYSVLENTRDYSNGQIIIGPKPNKVRCELRHAFTCHSIQGETASDKLFIDLDRMYDVKMIYTAMSRARTMDQIVFVK